MSATPARLLIMPAILGLIAIGLLWLLPSVGLFIALAAFAFLTPWGRTYTERAVISIIVMLGVIAIVFPRNSSVPIDSTTARITFTVFIVLAVALRFIPRLRAVEFPRVTVPDALILLLFVGSSFWLVSAYIGADSSQILSGLFMSGWDNHGHFSPFANTYVSQQTAWTTIDGSTAWNQWYPAVHSTTWTLAEMAADGDQLSRAQLLGPYVQWTAISFAAAMATITWVAGDLAQRISRKSKSVAAVVAILITGTFTVLGSPAFLFNLGFTNFAMGVALVLAASYLSTRSVRSSVTLGWFVIPLAIIGTIGLWTPLVLGLMPAGLVVAIRLWNTKKVYAIVWVALNAIAGVVLVLTQLQAILGAEEGATASDFNEEIGAVGTGMAQFEVGIAIVSPILAVLFIVLLVQRKRAQLAVSFAGPIFAGLILAIIFGTGAVAANLDVLTSYYVLKVLDGMLLTIIPITAAFIGVAMIALLSRLPRAQQVTAAVASAVLLSVLFGYVGPVPTDRMATFIAAPGIEAGVIRADGVENQLVGEGVMASVEAAVGTSKDLTYTPLQWDGSGTLVNLWLASLTSTLSVDQRKFYAGLPEFPYDKATLEYVAFALNVNKNLNVAAYWFRPSSGDLLETEARRADPQRFTTVETVIPPSDLCPECEIG
jgi:hypothetical protein